MSFTDNTIECEVPDDFQLLRLEPRFEMTNAQLEERQRDLSRVLHPDRFSSAPPAQRRAALSRSIAVNDAVRRLKDPVYRGQLLLKYKFGVDSNEDMSAAPGLLMEVMELREQLAGARTRGSAEEVERLARRVRERQSKLLENIATGLDGDSEQSADSEHRSQLVATLRSQLSELRYLVRFVEEVGRIQDELP